MIQGGIIQNMELKSSVDSLSEIENFIDEVCEQYKFGEEQYGNILIALTEAVNNAIKHGNKSDPKKKVFLTMETTTTDVEFTIRDEGPGFDPATVPDPTLPENLEKLSGRGIFLMQNLADSVEFKDDGRTIALKFSVSGD